MTVYDLCNLFCDNSQIVEVWSLDKEKVVYKGEIYDMPYEIENEEVMSIDSFYGNVDYLTINIE